MRRNPSHRSDALKDDDFNKITNWIIFLFVLSSLLTASVIGTAIYLALKNWG